MSESMIPFGAGLAVGALVTGVIKVLCLAGLGIGIGIGVKKLMQSDTKENHECKCGPKQN